MNEPAIRQILLGMKAELAAGWIQGDLMEAGAGAAPGVCLFGALDGLDLRRIAAFSRRSEVASQPIEDRELAPA